MGFTCGPSGCDLRDAVLHAAERGVDEGGLASTRWAEEDDVDEVNAGFVTDGVGEFCVRLKSLLLRPTWWLWRNLRTLDMNP